MVKDIRTTEEFAMTSDGKIIGCSTVLDFESGTICIIAPDRESLIDAMAEYFPETELNADYFQDVFITRRK